MIKSLQHTEKRKKVDEDEDFVSVDFVSTFYEPQNKQN